MNQDDFRNKYSYDKATAVMQQFLDVKFAHLDCLLLFRMGDFYELFYEDAITASRVLGIALTKRGKTADEEIQMCGVPHHALENYMHKLLEDGFKVAICDQLETPEEAKKRGGYKAVVNRNVTRIITPGTIYEESLLEAAAPSYLCAINIDKDRSAICWLDISTSEIAVKELARNELVNEIARLRPNEILLSDKYRNSDIASFISTSLDKLISFQVDSFFASAKCEKITLDYYNISSLNAIGELSRIATSVVGAVLEYVSITQKENKPKLRLPKIVAHERFMAIDNSTRQNLEITSSNHGNRNTLFYHLNKTKTKGGSRLLYQFLSAPLINLDEINQRLDYTSFFANNMVLTEMLRNSLKQTADLERCTARINMNRATPRDLLSIKDTIAAAEMLYDQFARSTNQELPEHIEELRSCLIGNTNLQELIESAICEDAPNILSDGKYIKHSYHPKIAELYNLIDNGRTHIEALKNKYSQLTGVDSLKINHNNVLGLFIDVTTRNAGKMNEEIFIHRQSTANSARYTTVELQELETQMINARQLALSLERELFDAIVAQIALESAKIFALAECLAQIDVFTCFAHIADLNSYSCPSLTENIEFHIIDGRHPVVESCLQGANQSFVANDCDLNFDNRLWLLTGPNMAGKSTFLRQNALIAIMAHIGSFVPAKRAQIGVVDKIFSRIGAGDDLSRGQSTFMVEMLETASILAQSTKNSLIILDEVGRGTSTYDGVAIAWSVLEHIHDKIRARCLFATHYHELTKMDQILPALTNYTIAIEENDEKITFLHKIIQGAADRSYGVHVATLAGLPASVVKRAYQLLQKFEKQSGRSNKEILKGESMNMNLFETSSRSDTYSDGLKPDNSKLYDSKPHSSNPDNLNPGSLNLGSTKPDRLSLDSLNLDSANLDSWKPDQPTNNTAKSAKRDNAIDSKYLELYNNFSKIDPDSLTPREALDVLYKLKGEKLQG